MSARLKEATVPHFSSHPEVGGHRVPLSYYQPEYFERERRDIFQRVWLSTGWRGADIATAGAFFVLPLPIANTVLLFVRGEDGVVRGFHNVCTHRGNQVVWDECGNRNRFICSFHNWTFDTRGRLVGAPGTNRIANFDRSEYGLTPVAVELWNDFIFFSLVNPPQCSLREYLGEWGDSVSGYPFDKLVVASHYRAHVNANWKVLLDAFQEAYHVPFLHSRSQPDAADKDNPLAYALEIALYEKHRRLSFPANQSSVVYSRDNAAPTAKTLPPATQRLVSYGKQYSHQEFAPSSFPSGVNPKRASNWSFDINVVYPNWWVAVRGDHMHTYNFWPVTHDSTVYEVRFYYPQPFSVKERLFHEMRRIRVRNTLYEDLSTVERAQAVLNSGARDHYVLTDEEIMIAHHHYVGEQLMKKAAGTGEA